MSPIIRNYQESLLDNWLANSVRACLDPTLVYGFLGLQFYKSTYGEVNNSSQGESIPAFLAASVAVEDGCIDGFCVISLPIALCHVVCLHISKELIAPSNEWCLAPDVSPFKSWAACADTYYACWT